MKQEEFLATIIPMKDKIYRLAKRILVSNDEAEDAVQEVFLKLLLYQKERYFYCNLIQHFLVLPQLEPIGLLPFVILPVTDLI